MTVVHLASPIDFEGWRNAARALAHRGVTPESIVWSLGTESADLFAAQPGADLVAGGTASRFGVPRAFVALAEEAILHRDAERFALLYRLVWRLRAEPGLIEAALDPLVARLNLMAKVVRRDIHKMHAFLRFREVATEIGPRFVAWFEPDHHVLEAAGPFFARRFASMDWSILTPERSAHFEAGELSFGEGARREERPRDDAAEDLWRRYYAAIFNPARLKVAAMRAEMPQKYWRNLPEAELIKPLIASATRRTTEMLKEAPHPPRAKLHRLEPHRLAEGKPGDTAQATSAGASDIGAVRRDAQGCRACPLWADATQTVFGEGPAKAKIMFVGEQPGDQEDLAGKPFVGPAGRLLDKALEEAGIDRDIVYVTNAVKHFKFEPRGKRRIHKTPAVGEVQACRWWLTREIALVKPEIVVALGATAARSLFGKATPVNATRGHLLPFEEGGEAAKAFVTVHPSYLLRLPDEAAKASEYKRFVDDLRLLGASIANAA